MNKTKTIITCIFKYKGKKYKVDDIIPGCLEKGKAISLYKNGNYSDEIYRAGLIRIKYGDEEISTLSSESQEIELVNIEIDYN